MKVTHSAWMLPLLFSSLNVVKAQDLGYDPEELHTAPEISVAGTQRHRHVHRNGIDWEVAWVDVGNDHIYEGDILLDDDLLEAMTAVTPNTTDLLGLNWNSVSFPRLWPCPVPYEIEASYANPDLITGAIAEIERLTRWQFVERTTEADWMFFPASATGCSSFIGRLGGRQNVNVNPFGCAFGSAIHEIFHALGMWHEQSRADRDPFITVDFSAIQAGRQGNFFVQQGDIVGPYDFDSLMHYGLWGFSVDGRRTIVPNDGQPGPHVCHIGQRDTLSQVDVETVMLRWTGSATCGFDSNPPPYEPCEAGDVQMCGWSQRSWSVLNGLYKLDDGSTWNGRPTYTRFKRTYRVFWTNNDGGRWVIGTSLGTSFPVAQAWNSAGAATPDQATDWRVNNVADPNINWRACGDPLPTTLPSTTTPVVTTPPPNMPDSWLGNASTPTSALAQFPTRDLNGRFGFTFTTRNAGATRVTHAGFYSARGACANFRVELWDTQAAVRLAWFHIDNAGADVLSVGAFPTPVILPPTGPKYALTIQDDNDSVCQENSLHDAHRNPADLDWNAGHGANWDPNDPYLDIQESGYCVGNGCATFQATGSPRNYFLLLGYTGL